MEPTDQDVLKIISQITGDDFCEELDMTAAFHPEKLTPLEKQAHEKLSRIYMLAHSHDKSASCYRVHGEWRKLAIEDPPPENNSEDPSDPGHPQ